MANEEKLIVGVWKLVSVMYEDQETKAMTPIMGDNPRGYQIATPEGRWLALATPSGRTAPATDEERAQAFRTMIGYSGRYRVNGSTITTKVERPGTNPGSAASRCGTSDSRTTSCSSKARRCRIPTCTARPCG